MILGVFMVGLGLSLAGRLTVGSNAENFKTNSFSYKRSLDQARDLGLVSWAALGCLWDVLESHEFHSFVEVWGAQ